jgi:outer membrane protein OmpA-like peptidoglycan-associated protein
MFNNEGQAAVKPRRLQPVRVLLYVAMCWAMAAPLCAQGPVRIAASVSPGVQKRELDSAEAVLRAKLNGLAEGGGIALLREPLSLTLRIPARVLFDPDSAHLKQGAAKELPWLAVPQLLRTRQRLVAQVDVYTDSIGGQSANQRVSEQRAQSLVAALQAAAIRPQRLQAKGMGPSSELDVNDTAEGRDQNRRVEVVFELTQASTQ